MQTKRSRLRVAHVVSLIGTCAVLAACGPGTELAAPQEQEPAPAHASTSNSWLQGTTDERFEIVTRHLRGLDMAMIEIGYRYQELYRAGQSENWDYATYQVDKTASLSRTRCNAAPGGRHRPRSTSCPRWRP